MPDKKQLSGVNWELANEAAVEWARRHSTVLVDKFTEVTRDKIRRSVSSSLAAGENQGQLRDRIMGTGAFSPDRALLIARTEVTASYAQGNLAAYKESGVTEGTMWNTRNDSLVCAICGPLDGVVVPLGGEFDGAGEGPEAHPGCRCWLTPRMLGDTETRADIDAIYGLERMPGIGAPRVPSVGVPIFTTTAEAGEWLTHNIDSLTSVSLGDMHQDVARELAEQITYINNKYGLAIKSIEVRRMGAAAQYYEGHLEISAIIAESPGSFKDKLEALYLNQDSLVPESFKEVITHEAAHSLDPRQYDDVYLSWGDLQDMSSPSISRYALTNGREMAAEAFVLYERGEVQRIIDAGLGDLIRVFESWIK